MSNVNMKAIRGGPMYCRLWIVGVAVCLFKADITFLVDRKGPFRYILSNRQHILLCLAFSTLDLARLVDFSYIPEGNSHIVSN